MFQSASRIMLVKPAVFEFNPQTSTTNVFQLNASLDPTRIQRAALSEWNEMYSMYVSNRVPVDIFESHTLNTPDAIFPNCISTFQGSVFGQSSPVAVLHPMHNENRRAERSEEIVQFFRNLGYTIKDDLLKFEKRGLSLEGTGSVVMDHVNKIAYCALSERSDLEVAEAFAAMIGYELVPFRTNGPGGKPVYHTDLVMNINTGFAEVCTPVIVEADQGIVLRALKDKGRDVIELNDRQFKSFCGNSLEVRNVGGERLFSMSTRSFKALSKEQREVIESHVARIIHAKIRMVERVGGGSGRCLTQELHGLEEEPVPANRFENAFETAAS